MSKYQPCPCSSTVLYQKCCGPLHGGKTAENALQLMRSRFSAFALGLTEYLIKTTHPENPERQEDENAWKDDLEKISKQARFDGLKVIEFEDGDDRAKVIFTAYISRGDEDLSFTEESHFVNDDGNWLYKEGKIIKSGQGAD